MLKEIKPHAAGPKTLLSHQRNGGVGCGEGHTKGTEQKIATKRKTRNGMWLKPHSQGIGGGRTGEIRFVHGQVGRDGVKSSLHTTLLYKVRTGEKNKKKT